MAFWLDEPRLHDASLYLPALPLQYEPDRLLTIFHNDKVLRHLLITIIDY